MTCNQAKQHFEEISDSAADIQIRMEVESHLSACPNCARVFAELQHLDARLAAGLKTGKRTPALWDRIETMIVEEAKSGDPQIGCGESSNLAPWQLLRLAAERWLKATPLTARVAWTSLAGTWSIILLLNMTSHDLDAQSCATTAIASNSEASATATRQHLMAVELAVFAEPGERPKRDHPGPRTEQKIQFRNA